MEPGLKCDLGQLIGGFQAVVQVQPALGGSNVLRKGRFAGDDELKRSGSWFRRTLVTGV
jgi:hypothetical protein